MKITKFEIEICRESVLNLINCHHNSEIYETVIKEYEEVLEEVYKKLHPVALLSFGMLGDLCPDQYELWGGEALFGITSVGDEISTWSSELFETGDYLRGLLVDAMADDYLFQMDHQLAKPIISLCRQKKCGVSRRLEAPQDISMAVQKTALEAADGEALAGIQITESMMFNPVKTTCQVYLLDENPKHLRIVHDCSSCPNVNCKMRKTIVNITVDWGDRQQNISGIKGQTALEILRMNDIPINAVCGGKGTCGKCRVRISAGMSPLVSALACRTPVEEDCTVVPEDCLTGEFSIVTDYEEQNKAAADKNDKYGIAVDIGTTTIAMQLISEKSGTVVDTYAALNSQRPFGADVISRIEASNTGKKAELRQAISQDLLKGIRKLTGQGETLVERMVIGGNTTMIHLLMGYSCETLGVYPFQPINVETIHTTYGTLFEQEEEGFSITICPGISAFVGGDITTGLMALDFDKNEKISLLIDLGTNGEMAIGNCNKILVTSTAAGPAFEGGNIICGIGSVPGAICALSVNGKEMDIRTIGDEPACGICGTGVIDATYEFLKEKYVDETGMMVEEYFDDGVRLAQGEGGQDIAFYQKDIREIQLAKSAIRAGAETLVLCYGTSWDMIDKVYVAGGFGYHIDISKAVRIGLFPKACENKIKAVGNTCLKGAALYLRDETAEERMSRIRQRSEEVQLANDKNFNELYMEHMYFESN